MPPIELNDLPRLPDRLALEGCLTDPETGEIHECRMAFVSEDEPELLELARQYDVPVGSLLTVPARMDRIAEFHEPAEFHGPAFILTVTTRDMQREDPDRPTIAVDPFSAVGWETLRRLAVTDDELAGQAAAWVQEINLLHDRVEAAIEEDPAADLPPGMVAWMLCCRIADRVDVEELPEGLDYDMVARHCAAAEIDRKIALLEGRPQDGDPLTELTGILGPEVAAEMRMAPGSRFRAGFVQGAAADGPLRDISRRNDTLVRRLFSRMTRTPVEQITCGTASRELHGNVCACLEAAVAEERDPAGSGDPGWKEEVAGEIRNLLEDVFGRAYDPQVKLWEVRGNDVLTVRDLQGTHLYSWPVSDRNPVFVPEGEAGIPMIDPALCPDPEALAAKREHLVQLLIGQPAAGNDPEAAGPAADGGGANPDAEAGAEAGGPDFG